MIRLIRGLPGSGKSTYAKSFGIFHIEADMYFIHDGTYEFDREEIGWAHEWCYNIFIETVKNNIDIIVSNTFVTKKAIEPYIKFAELYNSDYQIIAMTNNFNSTHGVPESTFNIMKKNWENVPGEILIHE